jgi:4-hydroxybutyrate dehydrogenase
MQQYNYPTTLYFGQDSILALAESLKKRTFRKVLLVTDSTLASLGIVKQVLDLLKKSEKEFIVFDGTHPNPIEEDVEKASKCYQDNQCEAIIALGGGSPMDVAKVVKIRVTHEGELSQYDDAIGGETLITNPMPTLYAIPTTAGTGSEVGRVGVIIMRKTSKKTLFFSPQLMPEIAVLDPIVCVKLPSKITAATGIDALTHCIEAYLAPGFHPMSDGIALQGISLILKELPKAYQDGYDLEARAKMLMAATMGATAFQKGLGMVHSLAHPLSSQFNLHHGLANALLLPESMRFLENKLLLNGDVERMERLYTIQSLFEECQGYEAENLSGACTNFIESLGVKLGLENQGIKETDLESLSSEAIEDPCHATNIIPVTREDLIFVYKESM